MAIRHVDILMTSIQSSAVIERSNMIRYCMHNCRNWGITPIRWWTHKTHNRWAMGCLVNILEQIDRVITATHFIVPGVAALLSPPSFTQSINHYSDDIMGTFASQITSLTLVYSIIRSDADQRKHQSSASLAFVRGIHRGPANFLHKWPVTRKMFLFDDVIMRNRLYILLSVISTCYADRHCATVERIANKQYFQVYQFSKLTYNSFAQH